MAEKENVKILIDFDGTLVDSSGCWQEAYKNLCLDYEKQPDETLSDQNSKLDFSALMTQINKQFSEVPDIWERLLFRAKLSYIKREPKVEVLDFLKVYTENSDITLVSREPEELLKFWLSSKKINFITRIMTACDERKNSDFYKYKYDILIDDNFKNCQAAKTAKIKVIGVNDHHTKEQKAQMKNICDIYIGE